MNDLIVVLGSGVGILNLTEDQKKFINKQKVKISVNKYGIFYKEAGITPSDIFFLDFHDAEAKYFIKKTLMTIQKNLHPVNFIVDYRLRSKLTKNQTKYQITYYIIKYFLKLRNMLVRRLRLKSEGYENNFLKKISRVLLFKLIPWKKEDLLLFNKILPSNSVSLIKRNLYRNKVMRWAEGLNHPLFYYNTSFTCLLNYISIEYPNKKVLLLGCDFILKGHFYSHLNDKKYVDYFEKRFPKKCHRDVHSAIESSDNSLKEALPFIFYNLRKNGISLFVTSKKSLFYNQNFNNLFRF